MSRDMTSARGIIKENTILLELFQKFENTGDVVNEYELRGNERYL